MEERKRIDVLLNGLIKENPVLVLVIGTCPTLATSTSVETGFGMGLAATAVLVCSNIVISALHNIIPDKVRIPCFITVIAGFVTIVQMLLQAFVPSDTGHHGHDPRSTRKRHMAGRRLVRTCKGIQGNSAAFQLHPRNEHHDNGSRRILRIRYRYGGCSLFHQG